jgi:hypothetical protein
MLSLRSPLHSIPVVHDIHLFHNAGYSIHNEPKREKKNQNTLFPAFSTNIKHRALQKCISKQSVTHTDLESTIMFYPMCHFWLIPVINIHTFILFIPCIVNWFTNSISTNKCTILYIVYCTTNLLLHVLTQLLSSGSLHQRS